MCEIVGRTARFCLTITLGCKRSRNTPTLCTYALGNVLKRKLGTSSAMSRSPDILPSLMQPLCAAMSPKTVLHFNGSLLQLAVLSPWRG